jgi:hypothetical protein
LICDEHGRRSTTIKEFVGPCGSPAPRGDGRQASSAYVDPTPPVGAEDLALGLLALTEGPVPPILAALGASAPVLRAAVLDRYRKAG